MKSSWKCPKCSSERIGYLEDVLGDGEPHGGSARTQSYGKRKVGMAHMRDTALTGQPMIEGYGELEGFVCTACGYFEEYVRDPDKIDWDRVEGFRWCRRPGQ